jgi:hypothetical protein
MGYGGAGEVMLRLCLLIGAPVVDAPLVASPMVFDVLPKERPFLTMGVMLVVFGVLLEPWGPPNVVAAEAGVGRCQDLWGENPAQCWALNDGTCGHRSPLWRR